MNNGLYFCTQKDNTCIKKDTCKRYIEAKNNYHAPLFNMACAEFNNYVLYIKIDEVKDNEERQSV